MGRAGELEHVACGLGKWSDLRRNFSFHSVIEDLTHKTGNFKQFSIFCNMLESALTQVRTSFRDGRLLFPRTWGARLRMFTSCVQGAWPSELLSHVPVSPSLVTNKQTNQPMYCWGCGSGVGCLLSC